MGLQVAGFEVIGFRIKALEELKGSWIEGLLIPVKNRVCHTLSGVRYNLPGQESPTSCFLGRQGVNAPRGVLTPRAVLTPFPLSALFVAGLRNLLISESQRLVGRLRICLKK